MSLAKTMLYYEDAKNKNSNQGPIIKPSVAPTSPEIIELFKGVASKDVKEAAESNKKDENKKG